MPHKIREMAKRILRDPQQINIALSKPAAGVSQGVYIVHDAQKMPLLVDILSQKQLKSMLVFASTKDKVKQLELELKRRKFNVAAIHSDLEQAVRKSVLRSYANREIQILVATDILSRGIDVDEIGLVINYDVPGDAEDYVHRVGRTARAESTGEAITFVGPADQSKFSRIEQLIGDTIPRLEIPESLGPGPEYNPRAHHGHAKSGGRPNQRRRRPNGGNRRH